MIAKIAYTFSSKNQERELYFVQVYLMKLVVPTNLINTLTQSIVSS